MFRVLTAITLLTKVVYCQNPSPCPNILTYDTSKTDTDRWYGVLSIPNREDLTGLYLNILLDRPAELLGNWIGDTTSTDNVEFNIINQRYRVEAETPISIKFFVKYNSAQIVPSIRSIRFNGRTICAARNQEQSRSTTERLHISHNNNQQSNTKAPTRTSRRPQTTTSTTTESTRRTTTKRASIDDTPTYLGNPNGIISTDEDSDGGFYESEILNIFKPQNRPNMNNRPSGASGQDNSCGKVAISASPLISHGEVAKPGQWPWHCALYYSKGIQLIYLCGSTLISEQHIVTAAHCVTKPHTSELVNMNNIRMYCGKHSLIDFGSEVQERALQEIYVHPNYNYSTYYNDIAVLKLSKPVEVTNFVRTVCLWNDDTDLNEIIGKPGTVVGWGFNQKRQLSNKLIQAQMPVVSTLKCIYSNREFFSQFTFENNFCAGFRNGTTVCSGDSGGGMVFPRSGTSGENAIWQIRGIVSVGVGLQEEGNCNPSQYSVFTDVAKYMHWIRQVVAL